MKTQRLLLRFAMSFVLAFFIFPVSRAAALGPAGANCHWGDYSRANTNYLSPSMCSGNCQTIINNAITAAPAGGAVFLRAGTYVISAPVYLKSDVTLEGDQNAVLQLRDHANWPAAGGQDPLIGARGRISNVEIKCFAIDGNYSFSGGNKSSASCWRSLRWNSNFSSCESQSAGDRYAGLGYYTLMYFSGATHLAVHDMLLQDGTNDGLKLANSSDVAFYNNFVNAMGHEALFAMTSHGIEAYGNKVALRASGGFRGDDCYDYNIHDNELYTYVGQTHDSSAGIQIDNKSGSTVYGIRIYRNVMHDIWNGGIWLSVGNIGMYNGGYPIEIHHNLFLNNGFSTNPQVGPTGGIISNATITSLVANNVFDGNWGAAINSSGSRTKAINNIILNTKAGKYSSAGSGKGIAGSGEAGYNCFFQNAGGDHPSTVGVGNISADPLFANAAGRDYHLRSRAGRWDPAAGRWVTDAVSSPAIDLGFYGSDYAREPENNGDRINAGAYGNTSQASLTGAAPQAAMPPAPTEEDFSGYVFGSGSGAGSGTGGAGSNPGQNTGGEDDYLGLPGGMDFDPADRGGDAAVDPLYGKPENIDDRACVSVAGSAGLIPCGKATDDPATSRNECAPCGLRELLYMVQLVIEFMLKLSGILTVLALVAGGLLYVTALGNAVRAKQGKNVVTYALIGFVLVFIAWAVVASLLTTLGYIDPLDGVWYAA